MLIKGERIGLCAMEAADTSEVHGWVHEPDLRRLAFMDYQFPQTQEATCAWIQEMNHDPRSRLLAIRGHEDNALIGMLTVRRISWISRSLRFGIMLWPPAVQGHGLGTEARRIFLDYVFRQMNFRRVYGDFFSFNVASRKSHEKLGAVVSARAREAGWADGAYFDVCHYTYQRELFLKSAESMPRAAVDDKAECVTGDMERCYMDFQLVPDLADGGANRAEWLRRLDGVADGDALAALQVDWTRRSASLLLFRRTGPAAWQAGAVPRELLARVLDRADHELNLHRIQAVAPVTARGPRTLLGSAGFEEEGTLDALHYAHGRYVDLAILGRVRPD